MKSLLAFAMCMFYNRLSWFLVITHLGILAAVFVFKQPLYGFSYHFYEEPFYYKLLIFVDLPSLVITGLIVYPFYQQDDSSKLVIAAYYILLVVVTSIQWGLIGFVIRKSWDLAKQRMLP
jgi:hypothetical protein